MSIVPQGAPPWGRAAVLLLAGALAGAGLSAPVDPDAIRDKLEAMRAAGAIQGSDGRTTVSGAALPTPDKLALLRFLEETRHRTARLLGIRMEGSASALWLFAVAGEPGAPCQVRVRILPGEKPPIRIVVTAPESLQASELADHVCRALLRADALAQGCLDPADSVVRDERSAPYPAWFGAGVARLLDPARRQEDAESVLERWCRAELPEVLVLADAFSPYASADPALAAQLVAWLLDGPERGAQFAALRRLLVQGQPWDAALLADVAGCQPEPGAADACWDAWLLARRWAVLTPGVSAPGLVRRTRAQLPVRPAVLGSHLATFETLDPIEPEDLLDLRAASWLGTAVAGKLGLLQRLGAGRGDAYRAMTEAYSRFFLGLLRGSSRRRLEQILQEADAALRALEGDAHFP